MHVKKEERKERQKKALRFLLVVFVIHLILVLIKLPHEVEKEVETRFTSKNDELPGKKIEQQCFTKRYEWDYRWEGYNEAEFGYISPNFRLFNTEDRRGTFYVEFGFFDQEKYDFNLYRGKEYATVSKELPWSAASMYSENISVTIGPNEGRLVTSYIRKAEEGRPYWAYAIVTEPSYRKCETIVEEIEDATVVKRNVTKKEIVTETEYVSLWDLFIGFLAGE